MLAVVVIAGFGLLFSGVLYVSEMEKARSDVRHAGRTAELFVSGVFREIANTIAVLKAEPEIRDGAALGPDARQRVVAKFRTFANANRKILFVYSAYSDGSIIIDSEVWPVPAGYDPTVRPWYTAAMQTKPDIAIGVPYQEYTSGRWVISTSQALEGSDGRYAGVVSIDYAIDDIVSVLLQFTEYETGRSFVLDAEGRIILHRDTTVLGATDERIDAEVAGLTHGQFVYQANGETRLAHFRRVPLTGWVIVTDVERREVLVPVMRSVAAAIGVTAVIAMLIAFVQSLYLSRTFGRPLGELKETIRSVIAGETDRIGDYSYPENEIGEMAAEIGRLAGGEIHAKNRALRESEEKLRMFFSQSLNGFFVMMLDEPIAWSDASAAVKESLLEYAMGHLRMDRVNQAMLDQYGAFETDFDGLEFGAFFADDLAQGRAILERVFENGRLHVETREKRLDGTPILFEGDYICLYDDHGRVTGQFGVQSDITNRKRIEEEVARQLGEKETLLREVHHRVKNNIAAIKGLLSLQAGSATSAEARSVLEDAVARVQSMADLYDSLLLTGEYREVSMKEYIEALVGHIVDVFPESTGIAVETRVDELTMDPKNAVSVGIILNELMTNAIKYAFPGRERGSILVTVESAGGVATLTVQDNGVGIDDQSDRATGFGLTLVRMLANQLAGTFAIESGSGTRSVLTFSPRSPSRQSSRS